MNIICNYVDWLDSNTLLRGTRLGSTDDEEEVNSKNVNAKYFAN